MKATEISRSPLAPQPTEVQMCWLGQGALDHLCQYPCGWWIKALEEADVAMNRTVESKNKALVLEAFDTLFNKRNYAAAEKFWSPHYIQHSAHIAPGREGLFDLIKSLPPTLKYEHGTIVELRPPCELDCGGHRSHQRRRSGRALGCDPRRGHTRAIKEWSPNVRPHVRDLCECPIKNRYVALF